MDLVLSELTWQAYEGRIEENDMLTVLIRNVEPIGLGRIVHGDGAVYQKVKFEALVFRPLPLTVTVLSEPRTSMASRRMPTRPSTRSRKRPAHPAAATRSPG